MHAHLKIDIFEDDGTITVLLCVRLEHGGEHGAARGEYDAVARDLA